MSEYVTVNCIEYCPKCKHKISMEPFDENPCNGWKMYKLNCDYSTDIIINPLTECNGMFEPKEDC